MTLATGRSARGVALLEVLIAVVVIAIGVIGALDAMATAIGAVATAGDRLRALGRLEDELVALRAEESLRGGLAAGGRQGSWPWPRQATWEASVTSASASLMHVALTAHWGPSQKPRTVRLTTAAAAPSGS